MDEDDTTDTEKVSETTYTIYTATTTIADYNAKISDSSNPDSVLQVGKYITHFKGDSYATNSALFKSSFTWTTQSWTEAYCRTYLSNLGIHSERIDSFINDAAYGFALGQTSDNVYLIFRFSDTTNSNGGGNGTATDFSIGTENFIYVAGTTIQSAVENSQLFIDGRVIAIADFYMCDHEVTQKEFQTVMGISQSSLITSADGTNIGIGDNLPVYYINWYAAIAYCNKLSVRNNLDPVYSVAGITDWQNLSFSAIPVTANEAWNNATFDTSKNGYRLPTEAEWEYASRGGKAGIAKTQYTFSGSDTIGEVAWYSENGAGTVHTVKQKKANELALYDMTGNVAEWCWDWYGTVSSATTATGNASGTYRLLRGGSWHEESYYNRLITRGFREPYNRGSRNGFRVVRNATTNSANGGTTNTSGGGGGTTGGSTGGGSGTGTGSGSTGSGEGSSGSSGASGGSMGGDSGTSGSSTGSGGGSTGSSGASGGSSGGGSGTASSSSGSGSNTGATGSVTVVGGISHGTVTVGKTTGVAAGEIVSITLTPDDGYTLGTLLVTDGDGVAVPMIEETAETEYRFIMPESSVTVNATYKERNKVAEKIGKYGKPYVVGDIVFNDGSAIPYTSDLTLTEEQKSKAIAVIFYVGTELNSGDDTTTSRTLGVGLVHSESELAWCTSSANAYSKNITTIQCPASGSAGALTFTGDKNGSDNLSQIAAFLTATDGVEDDTATEANYPAFYFAKNYASQTGSHVSGTDYEGDWYLPSIAELFQIWKSKETVDAASDLCGRQKFGTSVYWSSSQYASYDNYAFILVFYYGDWGYNLKRSTFKYACAVRAFN